MTEWVPTIFYSIEHVSKLSGRLLQRAYLLIGVRHDVPADDLTTVGRPI